MTVEQLLISKGYRLIDGAWYAPSRLPLSAREKPDPRNEPVAEKQRKIANPIRRAVRIKSFRCRLVDRDGVWIAYLIDALCRAGILFDDSQDWLEKIEVEQIKVAEKRHERTEVIIL